MLSANLDEILSELYMASWEKVFKWKEHTMSILADPFDHIDIQDIQCFFSSLRTWYGIFYTTVWCTVREEAAPSAWRMQVRSCQGRTD